MKGKILERDAHQFLWDLGYLVFPRLMIYATTIKSSKSIAQRSITDLDALGIKFGSFLEKTSFLVDCKHRSGGVFSQALKVLGLASMLKLDNTLVVRSSIDVPTQRFSELFGVRLVNKSQLQKMIRFREKGSFSLSAYKTIDELEKSFSAFQKSVYVRASNAFVNPDPYQRMKNLRVLYQETKRDIDRTFENKNAELLVYRLFQYSQLAIIEMASETNHLSDHHFDNYLLSKIIGDADFKIRALERMAIGTNPGAEISITREDLSPSYYESLKNLVSEIRNNPNIVQPYLRYTDLVIHQFGLPSIPINQKEVEDEIDYVDRTLFSEWNRTLMQIMDDQKTPPPFIIKLLA